MGFVNSFEGKDVVCIAGRINGTGTAAITAGEGFSLNDGGTGIYTITFDRAFDSLLAVVCSTETADSTVVSTTITHTDGTIGPSILFNGGDYTDGTSPVAKDIKFNFITIWQVDT